MDSMIWDKAISPCDDARIGDAASHAVQRDASRVASPLCTPVLHCVRVELHADQYVAHESPMLRQVNPCGTNKHVRRGLRFAGGAVAPMHLTRIHCTCPNKTS